MAKARLVSLNSAPRPAGRPLALPNVDALVARERPSEPLVCVRPATIAAASRRFVRAFPGDVLYAVKCNPEPRVLRAVWAGGVRHFDCASLPEIALVRRVLPRAEMHFMHPVKSRPAVQAAFHDYGVTDFALDSKDELEKILQETVRAVSVGTPPVLGPVRSPRGQAGRRLRPLRQVRRRGRRGGRIAASGAAACGAARAVLPCRLAMPRSLGLCQGDGLAAEAIALSGVTIDIVDVGGGFPVSYPTIEPPPLGDYMVGIGGAAAQFGDSVRLWAEPGRALVAGGGSVVVQVQLRRGDALYVNDGVYGSLSDAGHPGLPLSGPPRSGGRRGR